MARFSLNTVLYLWGSLRGKCNAILLFKRGFNKSTSLYSASNEVKEVGKDSQQIECSAALDDSFEFEETISEAKQVKANESSFRDTKLVLDMQENVNGQVQQHLSYHHTAHPEAVRNVTCQILDSTCDQYNGQDTYQYSPSFSSLGRISSLDSLEEERQETERELNSNILTTPEDVFEIYKESMRSRTETSAKVINNQPLRIKPSELVM